MLYKYIIKLFSCCFCFKKKDPRFYYLSLMKNEKTESGFSIHGLWPQYNLKKYPSYCKVVSFDITKLELLKEDLNKYWNTKMFNRVENFWEHEYKKHGSCMFTNMDEFEYFNITIKLYKEVIKKNLIEKYVDGNNCLIPISLDFKIIK